MSEVRAGSPFVSARPTSTLIFVLTAAMLACGFYVVFISGPAMCALGQEKLAQTLADETAGFCEKFGMRVGSAEFLKCSDELAAIRQKQTERDRAADQGIL
jgi:hypothetical protein